MPEKSTALTLPTEEQFKGDLEAINRFQQIARQHMVEGQDYGVIPGTQRPTLLKPGAEKIVKLMGLSDDYEILEQVTDWEKGFFHFEVKCILASISTGALVSTGLGACNSMEARYRWRWIFPSELPPELKDEKDKLVTRKRKTAQGWTTQYRVENDDPYTQVNTFLKIAKKRALVDAALSAGRLSEIFTQDMEDLTPKEIVEDKPTTKEAPQTAPEPSEQPETDNTDLRAIQVENLGEFFTNANKHYNLNQTQVLEKLGLDKKEQIDNPQETWLQLVEIMEKGD